MENLKTAHTYKGPEIQSFNETISTNRRSPLVKNNLKNLKLNDMQFEILYESYTET